MEYNYTHGGDVYRNPIEYDFSINVNPLGMPLASIQAAHEGIVLADIRTIGRSSYAVR